VVAAAKLVEKAGGDQITVHLREDRRHIQDEDVHRLRRQLQVPLNLEMSVAEGIVRIAKKIRPDWVCLVPERRQELTTEGGLDVVSGKKRIGTVIQQLQRSGIRVSLFVEPAIQAVETSAALGADAVELHTGKYCLLTQAKRTAPGSQGSKRELEKLRAAGERALSLGLGVHAGHGFDYQNIRAALALKDRSIHKGGGLFEEYNIGHAIVCRSVLVGLEQAVREMLVVFKKSGSRI